MSGCPDEPQGPRYVGAGNSEPRSGGTFVFSHESNIDTLDPHIAFNELSTVALRLVYDTLLDYEGTELVPLLAESMPEVSADGKRFTFTIRQGVRFHPMPFAEGDARDGRELVAEDFRYAFLRMMHGDTGSPGFAFYNSVVGAEAYRRGETDDVEGIEVLGTHRIAFQLTRADQTFLNALAMPFAAPMPRENVEHWGEEISRHPVGTGPFVFDEWERGVVVTFDRFEHYYDDRPRVDRMVYYENLSRGTGAMRFRNGGLSTIHRQSTQDYLFFAQAQQWQPYELEVPKSSTWGVVMNTEVPPFDNPHVRRAVAYGIDRASWARARSGRLAPLGQMVPPTVWGHVENLENAHHLDRERARRELAEAGYPNGLDEPITLTLGDGDVARIYGELFQSDMAEIGIEVELSMLAFSSYLQASGTRGRVQCALSGWNADFPDAANFFDALLHSDSIADEHSQNKAFYNNPELDAILDEARGETNRERRRDLYRQAAVLVNDDAPWAFVFVPNQLEVWQPYVMNYSPHPVWPEDYRNVWLDLPRRRATEGASPNTSPGVIHLLSGGLRMVLGATP